MICKALNAGEIPDTVVRTATDGDQYCVYQSEGLDSVYCQQDP